MLRESRPFESTYDESIFRLCNRAHSANLATMPVLERNAARAFSLSASNGERAGVRCRVPPISDHGQPGEIIQFFGSADQLRNAVNQLQSLLYAA